MHLLSRKKYKGTAYFLSKHEINVYRFKLRVKILNNYKLKCYNILKFQMKEIW